MNIDKKIIENIVKYCKDNNIDSKEWDFYNKLVNLLEAEEFDGLIINVPDDWNVDFENDEDIRDTIHDIMCDNDEMGKGLRAYEASGIVDKILIKIIHKEKTYVFDVKVECECGYESGGYFGRLDTFTRIS